ncbi:MAG: hypothetical protein HY543_12015 [Deltaproteobacteria bacterium]|nr:hypothetical protein [Deltaproteobacteria bacterium]
MEGGRQLKEVYQIVEREGMKPQWVRIGIGFVNRDSSINIRLDALPLDGRLQVRDMKQMLQRKEA